jgi:drug/metabolite transporter (DMT)-like permease
VSRPSLGDRWPVGALIVAAAAWGIGTVISRRAVEEMPPLTLLVIQLGASTVVLGAILAWRRQLALVRQVPTGLRWLGIVNPGLGYGLGLLGLASISASLAVLLWAVEPLLILVLAAATLHEPAGPRFGLLSLVALAGMVLVVFEPGATGQLGGVILTVAGVACCASYTVVSRRWLGERGETAPIVLVQQVVALGSAVLVVLAIAAFGGSALPVGASPTAWLSAVTSGVLYYAAAYVFYLAALRTMPAARAASSFYLIPVFGIAGSIALLGDQLTGLQWAGAAIALAAVFLILRPAAIARVPAG